MNEPEITVSVFMVTYNHEKYIAQAIESVINQKTNFQFELVIGEDCSTDNTRTIVESYKNKYPAIIKTVFQKHNVGIKANVESVFVNCKSKYVAILEGDDYWTDNNKLQKQIDFLENNLDYSCCFHNVKTIVDDNKSRTWNFCKFKNDRSFTFDDIINDNFIPTCSVVFRNNITWDFLIKLRSIMAGDWFLHIYNSEKGKIYFMNEFMGVYRVHPNGQWAGLTQIEGIRFKINSLFDIDRAFDFRNTDKIREIIFKMYLNKPVGYKDLIKHYKKRLKK
ncbi:MAG TPA: glycosyltransferase [Bacteroidia bacterium]|jgi:glycosyltransferase involved in cell wall biosynthesis|nr:glycosyltransferase [Bacteroidia bacterium]